MLTDICGRVREQALNNVRRWTCFLTIANPGRTIIYARVFIERRPYADEDSDVVVKLIHGAIKTVQLGLSSHSPEKGGVVVGVELMVERHTFASAKIEG